MHKSLEGIRIVELGTHVAVPLATRILTDWGAEVIKVESPNGEAYRMMGMVFGLPATEEFNVMFHALNANKKSICIDLKEDGGVDTLLKLIETADIFITNTRMKSLKKLGLDYESIKEAYPELIYAHFSGYGSQGDEKDRPGFDVASFWARGGALIEWMYQESVPNRPFYGFGDAATSTMMATGLLNSLYSRRDTGKGEYLELSLLGSALWYNTTGLLLGQPQFGHSYPASRYVPMDPMAPIY